MDKINENLKVARNTKTTKAKLGIHRHQISALKDPVIAMSQVIAEEISGLAKKSILNCTVVRIG